MPDELTRVSRLLSYVLRHNPSAIGIRLDAAGWVEVDELLAALAAHGNPIGVETLHAVVDGTDKRRLELRYGRVRAAQGHSIRVDLGLDPSTPPEVLFHGTVARFLPGIRAHRLRPGPRQHVHLSADEPTAATVGARRGTPLILRIDAAGMHRAGHRFFRAADGVWLTAAVPPQWTDSTIVKGLPWRGCACTTSRCRWTATPPGRTRGRTRRSVWAGSACTSGFSAPATAAR